MSKSTDPKKRLDAIKLAFKAEIANITATVSTEKRKLDKLYETGITKTKESNLRNHIDHLKHELWQAKLHSESLKELFKAIERAKDELQEWTPGILAAIEVPELYVKSLSFSHHSLKPLIFKKSSVALDLLMEEIQSYSHVKDGNEIAFSALRGLGNAIVGFVLTAIAVPFAFISGGLLDVGFSDAIDSFIFSFHCFKEAWTGKEEPPELKKLSEDIMRLKTISTPLETETQPQPRFFKHEQNRNEEKTPDLNTNKPKI